MYKLAVACLFAATLFSCQDHANRNRSRSILLNEDTAKNAPLSASPLPVTADSVELAVPGGLTGDKLVGFAKTLTGTPYKYASSNPSEGFDCSGFITYVFNHFGATVPRSSVDFTTIGEPMPLSQSQPGDLILFTGTDSTVRVVGHMGIITHASNDSVAFIHSTSGRAYGVTETPLDPYYRGRFVKVIRVLKSPI